MTRTTLPVRSGSILTPQIGLGRNAPPVGWEGGWDGRLRENGEGRDKEEGVFRVSMRRDIAYRRLATGQTAQRSLLMFGERIE